MIRKFLLPLLAVVGVAFALWMVRRGATPVPAAQPVAQPASAEGFSTYVAGAGIVESASENIAISPLVPGVVTELFVHIGSDVKAGDPLFKIDDRDLRAELATRRAALAS